MTNTITYRQVGDYLIPNLELPAEEKEVQIGVWGCGSPVETSAQQKHRPSRLARLRRKNYLIQNNRVLFNIMLADGTLWKRLAETDNEAEEMFSRLVNELAQAEGVTEKLKVKDQMAWVGAMNNICNRAEEIVNLLHDEFGLMNNYTQI